jgi:hypothetical protein
MQCSDGHDCETECRTPVEILLGAEANDEECALGNHAFVQRSTACVACGVPKGSQSFRRCPSVGTALIDPRPLAGREAPGPFPGEGRDSRQMTEAR